MHGPRIAAALACFAMCASCGRPSGENAAAVRAAGANVPSDPSLPGTGTPDPDLASSLARALRAKGKDYKPRTHHLLADGAPAYTNRLILETSPYLIQHAHNPVNWHAWGDEAFARAKAQDRPVLLSVGYSTCHWCHVMERESFEDLEIAQFMNANFVPIKVDREERPDVDALYMKAVQLLSGRGGWPMTCVLTPEREPFFAGTYFPARDGDRGAGRGFLSILRELTGIYRTDRDRAVRAAGQITRRLQEASLPERPGDVAGPEAIERAARELAEGFDPVHGGFGAAPKFPASASLELLLRYHRRAGDAGALRMAVHTLSKMAAGGIYDQVGGGFHRYSVDEAWRVPHFEKMLYDNAQLVVTYVEAFQASGEREFARIARETLDYLDREMSDPAGGFASATDADSPVPGAGHEEEGFYFTWTPKEIRDALDPGTAGDVIAYWGVTEAGNFEGRCVLHVPVPLEQAAAARGRTAAALAESVRRAREALRAERAKRPPPLRDGKVIASWNGLAISAFARGARALSEPAYARRAEVAAAFLLERMAGKDRLHRTWKDGHARHPGTLDDYAFVTQGLLDLFEATQAPRWLAEAVRLQDAATADFWDRDGGGFFSTPHRHEKLLARDKPAYDGAEPSGNSVAIANLLRLSELTAAPRWGDLAEKAIRAFSSHLRAAAGASKMLCALDFLLDSPAEVVLVSPEGADPSALLSVVDRTFLPNRILVSAHEGAALEALSKLVPLLSEKRALDGKPTAYVCRSRVCLVPTSDPAELARQLAQVDPLFPKPRKPGR